MVCTIVGVFKDQEEVQGLRRDLLQAGFPEHDIEIARSGNDEPSGHAEQTGFWARVKDYLGLDETENYQEATRRGNTVVSITAPDQKADDAVAIIQRHHPVNIDERSNGRGARATGQSTKRTNKSGSNQPEAIPVVEEQLKVGKRRIAQGGVRVFSHVTEKPVSESIKLREEHVDVERRPVNRPAGPEPFRERTIEASEMREEPVVQKEARVVEEVVVYKDVQERTANVKDTVRRTDVEVQKLDERDADQRFRTHYNTNMAKSGLSYDQCRPAYAYGHSLGEQGNYRGKDWSAIESDVRRNFEQRNMGNWDRMKSAVRHGYDSRGGRM